MPAVLLAEPVTALPAEALPVNDLLEELRSADIRIPRPAEVRDYVTRFPDIVPLVRRACEVAVAEFANRARLSLELYRDPEIDDRYLTLYVADSAVDAAVWQAIERIEEKYAEALTTTSGWLVVTPDFRGRASAKL